MPRVIISFPRVLCWLVLLQVQPLELPYVGSGALSFFLPALFLPSPFARCCLFFFHIQLGELVDNVLPGHHSSPCSKGWCSPCGTGVPNIPFAKGCCNPFSKVLFGREERIEKKPSLRQTKAAEQATLQKLHAETKPKKHEVTAPKRV